MVNEHRVIPGPGRGGLVGLGPGHRQGPGLQDQDLALAVHRELHVLGLAEVLFQLQPVAPQQQYFLPGQGRLAVLRLRDRFPGQARTVSGGGEAEGLGADVLLDNGEFRPFHQDEAVRDQGAFHHGGAQPPGGVDDDPAVLAAQGVLGEHDPRGAGRHHGQAAHAHGQLPVGQAFLGEIHQGGGGELAGQDLQIPWEKLLYGHIQLGEKLPGEGKLLVLVEAAAAQGQAGRMPQGSGEALVVLVHLFHEAGGDGGVEQLLTYEAALLGQFLEIGRVDLLEKVGQAPGEVILGQHLAVGLGGEDEAVRGGEVQAVFDLPQVGVFPPPPGGSAGPPRLRAATRPP